MKHALSIAAAALFVVVLSGKIVKAFNPQPDPPGLFGMVGITPEETLQLNIVNIQQVGLPPGPCRVTLRFLNSSGTVLKQAIVTVKPRQAASLRLTGAEAGGTFRSEVHPVLLVPTDEPMGCGAVGSAEVFNTSSGQTSLLVNPIYLSLPAVQR